MASEPDVAFTTDNVLHQLSKHGFPPAKWRELATHLHIGQGDGVPIARDSVEEEATRELTELITRWMNSESERSWRLLVDSVIRCNEMMVAKKLAHEVGVPFPGAHNQSPQQTPTKPPGQQTPNRSAEQQTPSRPPAQQTPNRSAEQQTPSRPPAQQTPQRNFQPEGGSAGVRGRVTSAGGIGSSAAGMRRRPRGMMLSCLPWRSCGMATALALVGVPVYLYLERRHIAGGIWSGAAIFGLLEILFHLKGIKTGSHCVEVSGVKLPPQLFSLAGGVSAGFLYWYTR